MSADDALVAAAERWPIEGVPRKPGAWMLTVVCRRGLDLLRRADRGSRYRVSIAVGRRRGRARQAEEARRADAWALALTDNPAEKEHLAQRLS